MVVKKGRKRASSKAKKGGDKVAPIRTYEHFQEYVPKWNISVEVNPRLKPEAVTALRRRQQYLVDPDADAKKRRARKAVKQRKARIERHAQKEADRFVVRPMPDRSQPVATAAGDHARGVDGDPSGADVVAVAGQDKKKKKKKKKVIKTGGVKKKKATASVSVSVGTSPAPEPRPASDADESASGHPGQVPGELTSREYQTSVMDYPSYIARGEWPDHVIDRLVREAEEEEQGQFHHRRDGSRSNPEDWRAQRGLSRTFMRSWQRAMDNLEGGGGSNGGGRGGRRDHGDAPIRQSGSRLQRGPGHAHSREDQSAPLSMLRDQIAHDMDESALAMSPRQISHTYEQPSHRHHHHHHHHHQRQAGDGSDAAMSYERGEGEDTLDLSNANPMMVFLKQMELEMRRLEIGLSPEKTLAGAQPLAQDLSDAASPTVISEEGSSYVSDSYSTTGHHGVIPDPNPRRRRLPPGTPGRIGQGHNARRVLRTPHRQGARAQDSNVSDSSLSAVSPSPARVRGGDGREASDDSIESKPPQLPETSSLSHTSPYPHSKRVRDDMTRVMGHLGYRRVAVASRQGNQSNQSTGGTPVKAVAAKSVGGPGNKKGPKKCTHCGKVKDEHEWRSGTLLCPLPDGEGEVVHES